MIDPLQVSEHHVGDLCADVDEFNLLVRCTVPFDICSWEGKAGLHSEDREGNGRPCFWYLILDSWGLETGKDLAKKLDEAFGSVFGVRPLQWLGCFVGGHRCWISYMICCGESNDVKRGIIALRASCRMRSWSQVKSRPSKLVGSARRVWWFALGVFNLGAPARAVKGKSRPRIEVNYASKV